MKKILTPVSTVVLKLLDVLKLNTPNRIVIALSPLFFSASGVILVLVARYCPLIGGHLTRDELVSLFIAGATLGSSKILMWLHGWQKSEARNTQPIAKVAKVLSTTILDPPGDTKTRASSAAKEALEGAVDVPPPPPGPPEVPMHEVGLV